MSRGKGLGLGAGRTATLAAILAVALAALLLPMPAGLATAQARAGLAVVLATVALLATGALPGIVTAALFFAVAIGLGVVPPMALVSGFWANSTLLIFGGLIIGTAAERSGLGRFVAKSLMTRFSGSYPRFLIGLLTGTCVLTFIIPSTMGRLAIMVPVVAAIAREAGYEKGSPGYDGALLVTIVGNFVTSHGVLTGNLTNVIVLGSGEALYGVSASYFDFLVACAPVLGLAKGLSCVLLAVLLFPAPAPRPPPREEPLLLGRDARRLAVVLALTVALWASDGVHGLKPGWVALLGALLCLVPPVSLVTLRESFDTTRLGATIIVPAVLGVATVLSHSGVGRAMTDAITGAIPLDGHTPAAGFIVVAVVSSLLSAVATIVGTIAIVTPLLAKVATTTGLPIHVGLLAEITGLQSVFFHYAATPILVGIAMAGIPPARALRLMVPLALLGLLLILPLEVLWLKLLGFMP